jgi:predicted metal-binding membrane protein
MKMSPRTAAALPLRLSGKRPSPTPVARGRLVVLAVLIALTIGTWGLTVYQVRTSDMPMGVVVRSAADGTSMGMSEMTGSGMAGMSGQRASPGTVLVFLAAWVAMMVAMMLPAAAPMLLLFHATAARRRATTGFVPTWVFVAGYFLVWAAVGVVTWVVVQLASDAATHLGPGDRAAWKPVALGVTLAAAGLYQLTPLKRVCLNHCRSPLDFLVQHWREGRLGALRMGLVHGLYCLGCCWTLFAVLVAAGVMSLPWMVLLTLLVFVEKALPIGRAVSIGIGVVLVALAVLVASGAMQFPWTV